MMGDTPYPLEGLIWATLIITGNGIIKIFSMGYGVDISFIHLFKVYKVLERRVYLILVLFNRHTIYSTPSLLSCVTRYFCFYFFINVIPIEYMCVVWIRFYKCQANGRHLAVPILLNLLVAKRYCNYLLSEDILTSSQLNLDKIENTSLLTLNVVPLVILL